MIERTGLPNKGMKLTSVEPIGRSQLIPGVRRTSMENGMGSHSSMISIAELWHSRDADVWKEALDRYWQLARNVALEHELEALDLDRIRRMDAQGWYEFLRDEYFRWKYTAPNRYATAKRQLKRHEEEGSLPLLHRIKQRLLALDHTDIGLALSTAAEIRGLGTAGASGLLALMYPSAFGTVDQFVVKALRDVRDLSEGPQLVRMNPSGLRIGDGVILIGIMRRKATQNNQLFNTDRWTPRKIDKILWTYRRGPAA